MISAKFKSTLIVCFIAIVAITNSTSSLAQSELTEQPGTQTISISNKLLSLDVIDQPLVDVLREIGDLANFDTYVIDESIEYPNVSESLKNKKVEFVVRRLLENINNVIYFKSSKEHGKQQSISQVWLVGLANINNAIQHSSQVGHDILQAEKIKSLNNAVVEMLHDDNILTGQEKNRVLTGLINILIDAEDPIAKSRAAIALGNFKDPRAITTLKHTLNINDPMVRSQVLYALGQIGGDHATKILGELLLDSYVALTHRTEAGKILESFKTEKADYYLELALNNSNQEIRMAFTHQLTNDSQETQHQSSEQSKIEQTQ